VPVGIFGSKITTPLFGRVVIFLGFFVLVSGVVGSRIIGGGKLLETGGFTVYGTLGKVAIFGLVAFVLLVWRRGLAMELRRWHPALAGWLLAAVALAIVAWMGVTNLLAGQLTATNLIVVHGGLIGSVACAALGCFGPANLRILGTMYRRELWLTLLIAAGFYLFLLAVYALWYVLAAIVLACVRWLLMLINLHAQLVPPNILLTDKFGITVAEYCSGIESIALFSGLYVIVGLLDRQRLRIGWYLAIFPVALLLLFGLNILRVFGLIVAGYYINPDIAFSLFHTYAGLMFFIIYSAVFWAVAYRYVVNVKEKIV